MKLKTVALVTLVMLVVAYAARIATQFEFILDQPLRFLISSLGTWALLFFFFMLYRHSGDE